MLANPERMHARPDAVVAARPGEECGAAAPSAIPARGGRWAATQVGAALARAGSPRASG